MIHENGNGQETHFTLLSNKKGGERSFRSRKGNSQRLTETGKGFIREFSRGKKREFFNSHGLLFEVRYSNGGKVSFNPKDRKSDKSLKSIKMSSGKQLFFHWNSSGRVKKIETTDGKSQYVFKGDYLSSATDLKGRTYKYRYSPQPQSNLIKAVHPDGSSLNIRYHRKTDWVAFVKERDGTEKSYKYGGDSKNHKMSYWTQVTQKGAKSAKEKAVVKRYEYQMKKDSKGRKYLHKMVVKVGGKATHEVIYSPSGDILRAGKGKNAFEFVYRDGQVREKKFPNGQKISLEYDNPCEKVSKAVNGKNYTRFEYDKKCNISRVFDSQRRDVQIIYDRKSRIKKLVQGNKKSKERKQSIVFSRNPSGRVIGLKVGKKSLPYGGDKSKEFNQVEKKGLGLLDDLLTMFASADMPLSVN